MAISVSREFAIDAIKRLPSDVLTFGEALIRGEALVSRKAVARALRAGVPASKVRLLGADLSGTDLTGVDFCQGNMAGADFTDCILLGANLDWCTLCGARFCGGKPPSKISDADLSGAVIDWPSGGPLLIECYVYGVYCRPAMARQIRQYIDDGSDTLNVYEPGVEFPER